MGLFDFRKPKWRHKDPAVRLAAIDSIAPQETELLAQLGREDLDRGVRQAAINRLTDVATLGRLVRDADPEDRAVIDARKDSLLYSLVVDCRQPEECQEHLAEIRAPELLAKLAVEGAQPELRLAAVNRIDDQQLLATVVRQNCGKLPATAALTKITDEALLTDLARTAAGKSARRQAAEKVAAIERQRNPPSDREVTAQQLHDLAAEAARLQTAPDIDAAAERMKAIREEWQILDRGGTHPAYGAFSHSCEDIEDRYRETLERRKMGQEKAARFDRFQARLEELCGIMERLTCSTAEDAESAREKAAADWEALVQDPDAEIVPSPSLAKRFTDACRAFDANRDTIRREQKLVQAINSKCTEIQALIAARELKKAAARLTDAEKSMARMTFNFFSKSTIAKMVEDAAEELNRTDQQILEQNLNRRRDICVELEQLAESDKPGQIEMQLHALSHDWQQLARLEGEQGAELDQRYRTIVDALTERCKTLEHEQDWELWANLTLKEKLVERVSALDGEDDLETVLTMVKAAQVEWKTIGHVPQRESQRLWDEFQDACNRNFERTKPYLDEQRAKRAEAMDRRREICLLAAELAESNDWQHTTRTIKAFQEEWKALPHGSRREENELYQQFRQSCDRYFGRRKEHYQRQDVERQGNLMEKEKLCEEAEQLAATPQLDHANQLKRLQVAWKKIGPAPRKTESDVWQRFKTACDSYFNWLAAEQQQNLQKKIELCAAAEQLAADASQAENRKEIAASLTELQKQWKEIGPVPPEQSEALWQRFRAPCDSFFAARQHEYEQEEQERRANQVKKEELLARATELADRDSDKETAAQLQQLQKEWFAIGPAPSESNRALNDRFKALCDAFFTDRRQYVADLKAEQLENQKRKEALCLRLENLLGLTYDPAIGERGKVLTLAEELKQAMEDNFMLAGRRKEHKEIGAEVRRIRQEWDKIGPVPSRQSRTLNQRFHKALDAYSRGRQTAKP